MGVTAVMTKVPLMLVIVDPVTPATVTVCPNVKLLLATVVPPDVTPPVIEELDEAYVNVFAVGTLVMTNVPLMPTVDVAAVTPAMVTVCPTTKLWFAEVVTVTTVPVVETAVVLVTGVAVVTVTEPDDATMPVVLLTNVPVDRVIVPPAIAVPLIAAPSDV